MELDFGHETGELSFFEFLSILLWVESPFGRLPQFPARYAQEVYFRDDNIERVEVHFSNHYYSLLANLPTLKSKVAVASITVQTKNGPVNLEAMVDTGGVVSIASRHLLSNTNPPKSAATHHARWLPSVA